MDPDEIIEEERRDILNQIRLDLLLRRLGTTVLRQKFMEFYAKLNGGKEWRDGQKAGEEFIRSKWGNGAYVNAQVQQQQMMMGGNILHWDLHCLQSVITQMLTVVLKENQANNNSLKKGACSQSTSTVWDRSWWVQMSKIRQLANIRNFIAHMPNGTLSQSEFDETWREAVDALKALGAKSKEIKEILQVTQSAFSLPKCTQQVQNQSSQKEASKKTKESLEEERITIAELQTKIKELQLKIQSQVKEQKLKDEAKGQLKKDQKSVNPVRFNKKNEWEAKSLTGNGDLECRSGDWDKAIEFYTKALEIPDISDDLRRNIYLNRSWVHLKILEMPEPPFDLNVSESETKTKSGGKIPSQSQSAKTQRESKFVDEDLLEMDNQKWPEKLTKEMQEFHLTAGIADAESALKLSPRQKSPKANYRLAQFHQIKGDWKTALMHFDLALEESDLDDSQLEFDRNVCQLELLNQAEVEEFNWILGKRNQTMAGLAVWRDSRKWSKVMEEANNTPQQLLYAQMVQAHSVAQNLCSNEQDQVLNAHIFASLIKVYEQAVKGGLPSGYYNLGLLLQEGNGVRQADFFGAVRLFKMAANFPINDERKDKEHTFKNMVADWKMDGIFEAQYRLGLCYESGLGVGKDEKKALHWFEMASLGEHAGASRKLGDIYAKGLLGVAKDDEMAIFCWEQAKMQGDLVAMTNEILHFLPTHQSPPDIAASLEMFSYAVRRNSWLWDGTPTTIATILKQKRHYQSVLATVLQELAQTQTKENEEPEGVSWNIPALIEHNLHTIHLLELAQTPEFLQKLEAIPNWRSQFIFTDRLVQASNSCIEGLAALQELNKLYVRFQIMECPRYRVYVLHDYPPDIRMISGCSVDEIKSMMAREAQLVTAIVTSFANSIGLVGAVFFRDEPTQLMIHCLVKKFYSTLQPVPGRWTPEELRNYFNATLLHFYTPENELKPNSGIKYLQNHKGSLNKTQMPENFINISNAAALGSTGNFEDVGILGRLATLSGYLNPASSNIKCDYLFVQAVCVKSAGLTRGVNLPNRKRIKEAMAIFQKFLKICPKDEPRRAEAHYQLALCTLYLEKLEVKGQSSVSSSTAKDILDKVLPHFTQGEAAEQLPWKDFQLPQKSPVKLFLQRKMKELEVLVETNPAQNLTSDLVGELEQSESYGRLIDPFFHFPASSFSLKLRGARRVEVILRFRRLFKAARERGIGSSSSPLEPDELAYLSSLPGSPCGGRTAFFRSKIMGCYEIVEPILHFRLLQPMKNCEDQDTIQAFTVVQDESGAVFNLRFNLLNYSGGAAETGEFKVGSRFIHAMPSLRLDSDGGTSLVAIDADEQIYHLPPTYDNHPQQQGSGGQDGNKRTVSRKCGFCGVIGSSLHQCSKCEMVYYCGKECQTADWNELKHKWICPFLKNHLPLSFASPVSGI